MSIEQSNVIDFIGTTPEEKVILTLTDHLSWNEDIHLQLLQNKINSYLKFIESGQIYKDYPLASAQEISIKTMKYEPDKIAINFVERCKSLINGTCLGFEWQTISV